MKKAIQPKMPVRWYAPTQKAFDRLMALGAPKRAIYEGWKAEHWRKVTMRQGESLGVLDGYSAFGGGARLISKAVDHFHGHGATIVDVETGRDSRAHGHILMAEATSPRRQSAEYKRKMADEKAEKRLESRAGMSKHEIEIEWKKPGIMSADERAKFLRIPRSTLYAKFGDSGAAAGRRPKHLLET